MNPVARFYQRHAWHYLYRLQLDLAAQYMVAAYLIEKRSANHD